jgi:dTMP kinase
MSNAPAEPQSLPQAGGRFIVIDGPDGAGKTGQANRLAQWLGSTPGRSVVFTPEPGGTALGGELRRAVLKKHGPPPMARAELFLFLADRAQHVQEVILPALHAGQWVVSDRFSMSTLAYQAIAHGLGVEAVLPMDEFARQGLEPDLTILLDVPAEVGLARVRHRENDRIEEQGVQFHRRVREAFLALARDDPRCVVIDASPDEEEVWAQVRRVVTERLLEGGDG